MPDEGTQASGKNLLTWVLLELGECHPGGLGIQELEARLRARGHQVPLRNLAEFLALFHTLGLLRQIGGGERNPVYAAVSPTVVLPVGRGAYDKLAERLQQVPALSLAYLTGEGEFGGVTARLHPAAVVRARERLKEAVAKIIADATEEAHLSDDPSTTNVLVSAIIALGTVGGSDEHIHSGRSSSD